MYEKKKLDPTAFRLESTKHFRGLVGKPVWFFAKMDIFPCPYLPCNVTRQLFSTRHGVYLPCALNPHLALWLALAKHMHVMSPVLRAVLHTSALTLVVWKPVYDQAQV